MGRLVELQVRGVTAAADGSREDPLTRIAKYVPAEILAFYSMWVEGVTTVTSDAKFRLYIVITGGVIGLLATPFYFWRYFPTEPVPVRKAHAIVSSIAFIAYGYSLSAIAIPSWVNAGIALLLTAITTLIAALVQPVHK